MRAPYSLTEDGFEIHFGVNYVGPFLLTKLLLPSMLRTAHPRVVNVTSYAHQDSDIRWDDVGFCNGKEYDPVKA